MGRIAILWHLFKVGGSYLEFSLTAKEGQMMVTKKAGDSGSPGLHSTNIVEHLLCAVASKRVEGKRFN